MFYHDGDTLYLTSWEYNAALILKELAKIADNNGAIVSKEYTNKGFIVNRSILENIRKRESDIIRLQEMLKEENHPEKITKALNNAINNYQAEIDELKAIKNDPVEVRYLLSISFVIDGVFYHYEMDDNPFFEFYYRKTPVLPGNKISRDNVSEKDKKEWLFDCFFKYDCSSADIKEAANLIFNLLMNAKNTPIIRDKYKTRVSNTYNNGYHYEVVYKPENYTVLKWLEAEK